MTRKKRAEPLGGTVGGDDAARPTEDEEDARPDGGV
jgi:hypothetical protein